MTRDDVWIDAMGSSPGVVWFKDGAYEKFHVACLYNNFIDSIE